MSLYRDVPDEFAPKKELHKDFAVVFRGTKSVNELTYKDFLPSHIQHKNKLKTFKNLCQFDYSLSLSDDLNCLKKRLEGVVSIKSFSQGFTTIDRGVSFKEKESEDHIHYFLYDYENNSPCSDFKIIELKNGK